MSVLFDLQESLLSEMKTVLDDLLSSNFYFVEQFDCSLLSSIVFCFCRLEIRVECLNVKV